jgi:hypothetical protein
METCPRCKKQFSGEKASFNCPYCGRGRWLDILVSLLVSAGCFILFIFVAPKIDSKFWRIVVFVFTGCGAIYIFPILGGLIKGLRARKQYIETPAQQPDYIPAEKVPVVEKVKQRNIETYLEPYYFFTCPNPSLIDALYTIFRSRPQTFIKKIGHRSVSVEMLSAQKETAAGIPFGGDLYVLNQSKPMETMGEVINSMTNQSLGNPLYIAYASIESSGESWIHDVLSTFTDEALKQGIVPPQMYVVDVANAAEYLISISQPL